MGPEPYVYGSIQIAPRLEERHAAYLARFSETRRMKRNVHVLAAMGDIDRTHQMVGLPLGLQGGYYVGDDGDLRDPAIIDTSTPPKGQPALRCPWTPTRDGCGVTIAKPYATDDLSNWLRYLIKHFLKPWGYVVNGTAVWERPYRRPRQPRCTKLFVINNHACARKCGAWRASDLPLMMAPLDLYPVSDKA